MPALSFELADEEFWTDPRRTLRSTIENAKQAGFQGILLQGPASVDLDRRNTLPLIGLRRATIADNFHLRHESHGIIVAVSPLDNSVFAAPAWPDKSEEKPDFTPPKEGFPEGARTSALSLDVRERLPELPWEPGKRIFTLYLFDRQSNPVPVDFRSKKIEETKAYRSSTTSTPRSVQPLPASDPHQSFAKTSGSPEMPTGEGIAIAVERPDREPKDEACVVRGSFRLKVLPGERLDTQPGEAMPAEGEEAHALVIITLIVLGKEIAGPYLFKLRTPARASSESGMVEGHFNVNLLRMPEEFGIPQEYVVRALHGTVQSAAVNFSVMGSPARK